MTPNKILFLGPTILIAFIILLAGGQPAAGQEQGQGVNDPLFIPFSDTASPGAHPDPTVINPEGATNIDHWNSGTSSWDLMTGTVTSSGGADPRWVQVTDVSSFSSSVLDNTGPAAVTLAEETTTYEPAGNIVIAIALMLLAMTGVIIWRRRAPW